MKNLDVFNIICSTFASTTTSFGQISISIYNSTNKTSKILILILFILGLMSIFCFYYFGYENFPLDTKTVQSIDDFLNAKDLTSHEKLNIVNLRLLACTKVFDNSIVELEYLSPNKY